jgi:hypothetical protein
VHAVASPIPFHFATPSLAARNGLPRGERGAREKKEKKKKEERTPREYRGRARDKSSRIAMNDRAFAGYLIPLHFHLHDLTKRAVNRHV